MYRQPFYGTRWGSHETMWRPPTDVYETDNSAAVIVEIAGLKDGDYEISLRGRALLISGERKDPVEKLAYQQMEIRYGRFRTEVYLPWAVDADTIDVLYDNGLLKVDLKKAQAHRIPIRVAQDSEREQEGQ